MMRSALRAPFSAPPVAPIGSRRQAGVSVYGPNGLRSFHTRGSSAWALVPVQATNLARNSENLSGALWNVAAGATVTNNTTVAPDGSTTADTLALTASGYLYQSRAFAGAVAGVNQVALSIWVIGTTGQQVAFRAADATNGSNQLRTTVTFTGALQRVTLTGAITLTTGVMDLGLDARPALGGNGAVTFAAWGLQIETGTTVGQYIAADTTDGSGTVTVLQSYATNVLRVVPSPAGIMAALREPASTNQVRNSTMQGAASGTSLPTGWLGLGTANGITTSIVGTGTENGMPFIDVRFQGTSTAASGSQVQMGAGTDVAAAAGQSWSISAFLRLVAGSFTNIQGGGANVQVNWFDAGSVYLSTSASTPTPTSAGLASQRYSGSFTAPATTGFVVPYVRVAYASGVAIDVTLRIGQPQLEQLPFATSPIPTSGSAVARARDEINLTLAVPGGTPFTQFMDFLIPHALNALPTNRLTGDNGIGVAVDASGRLDQFNGTSSAQTANSYTANTRGKGAWAGDGASRSTVLNAGAAGTQASPAASTTRTVLGQLAPGSDVQAPAIFIHEFRAYSRRLADAELQRITA